MPEYDITEMSPQTGRMLKEDSSYFNLNSLIDWSDPANPKWKGSMTATYTPETPNDAASSMITLNAGAWTEIPLDSTVLEVWLRLTSKTKDFYLVWSAVAPVGLTTYFTVSADSTFIIEECKYLIIGGKKLYAYNPDIAAQTMQVVKELKV